MCETKNNKEKMKTDNEKRDALMKRMTQTKDCLQGLKTVEEQLNRMEMLLGR